MPTTSKPGRSMFGRWGKAVGWRGSDKVVCLTHAIPIKYCWPKCHNRE